MDKCGICHKPAAQLFETGNDVVYACFKCQPLVPEVTIEDATDQEEQQEQQDHERETVIIEEDNVETSLYCAICHKTFQKNMQLQNHLRNHRAERRFVCTYCNKAFSQSNNLRAHLRIHTNERPYKCTECGKAFTQVTNLNNHVRLHTGERPFVCPEPGCNKAYAQVTNLNQHRKRHLSGRPVESTYDCTVCGQQFDQRNHMYLHRREAHADLKSPVRSPQRYICKFCEQIFTNERLFKQHVSEHVQQQETTPQRVKKNTGTDSKSEYACVFSVCAMRFATPAEHTEHLLKAHQLRVLSTRTEHAPPPRRGRPPKMLKMEEEDPLEVKDGEFEEVIIIKEETRLPKLKVQSLFQ